MPSICRSRRKSFSNSAKTPSIDKNALPAAVLVSMGCSVAFKWTPFSRSSCTMFWRSRRLQASRSILVTISVSPGRRNSNSVSSSLRPLRLAPEAFSARMIVAPAAFPQCE